MNCRHCNTLLQHEFVDLGEMAPSNAYLTEADLDKSEPQYPLRVMVCNSCWLVQTDHQLTADQIFPADYAYFSSYSSSWLAHSSNFVDAVIERFHLSDSSTVVEVAANDGYLLQFVQKRGIPCYGIEPTASTAAAARERGIRIIESFFTNKTAQKLVKEDLQADLLIANNVLAHVPEINDFVSAFAMLLKPAGVASFEFPYLVELIDKNQFDTIYHEHYSYLSLTSVESIFARNGLRIFDVEKLPTHGGSLRVLAQRQDSQYWPETEKFQSIISQEKSLGMQNLNFYRDFQAKCEAIKSGLVDFLRNTTRDGKSVVAYGAAAKGNTLLNFAHLTSVDIPYVVDKNPAKQGKFLPGSKIPVVGIERLISDQPDYIVILPWNLKDEIANELSFTKKWGAVFVVAVPGLLLL